MIYVGIDFSMNSTGMCVEKDGKDYFYNFRRKKLLVRTQEVYTNSNIEFVYLKGLPKPDTYSDVEYEKISEADVTANAILDILLQYNEPMCVAIEGFSYGGKGTRMFDLAGFQYVLRYLLYKNNLVEEFKFYPPTTVKMFAIKGNAKKEDMVNSFLDKGLDNDLSNISNDLIEKDRYDGPYTDLVDAYYIKEILKNI